MKRDFVNSVDRICEAVAKDNLLCEGALRLVAVTGEMCLFSITESRKVLGTFRIPIRQVSTSRVASLLRETLAGAVPNTATHALTGGGADLGEDETDEGLATTMSLNKDGNVGQIDQKWVRTKYLAQLEEPPVDEEELEEPTLDVSVKAEAREDDEDVELTKDNIKDGLKILSKGPRPRTFMVIRDGRKWVIVRPKDINPYVSPTYRALPLPPYDYHRWLVAESDVSVKAGEDESVELTKDNIKDGLNVLSKDSGRRGRVGKMYGNWTIVDPVKLGANVLRPGSFHLWVLAEAEETEAPDIPNIRLFVYDPELTDPIIRSELFGDDIPFEIAQMDDFVLANHISPAGEPTLTIHMDKGSKVVGLILTLTKDQINVADNHMDKYARIIYPVAGKQVFVYFMRQEMAPAAPPPVVESYEASISATFEPKQTLVFEAKDKTEQMGSEQGFDGGTSEPATTNPMGGGTTARSENLAGSDGEYRMGVTPPGDLNKATGIPFSSGTVHETSDEHNHLCKAIFLAGGPASGKSTAAEMIFGLQQRKDQLPTFSKGVRIVNGDDMLELLAKEPDLQKSFAALKDMPNKVYKLKPADMGGDMDSREVQNQLRPVAKKLMAKIAHSFFATRQAVVIDGTGKDYDKVERQRRDLKRLGYDCHLIVVRVDMDIAIKRNRARARSVPDAIVRQGHVELNKNLEKYRQSFGNSYHEVRSGDTSYEELRALGDQILDAPLKNRDGKEWMALMSLVQHQVEEAILEGLREGRDYAQEYKDYHGTPKQKSNRNNRNKARRKMELETGDDREVDHGKPLSLGGTNHKNNLHVVSFAKNRAKGAKYENAQKGHAVWWTTDKKQTPPGDPTQDEILMGRVDKIEGPRAHVVGIMSGKDMGWHKISDLNCPSSVSETHDANDDFVDGTMGTKNYIAAVAVIIKGDDVLLGLAKADDDRDGKLCFPGGGIDPQDGGDPLLAARREAYEEAGVSITPHSILDHPDKPGVAFVVSSYNSGQPEPNEEFTSLQWVPIDAAREDFPNVYPENRHILWRLSPGLRH